MDASKYEVFELGPGGSMWESSSPREKSLVVLEEGGEVSKDATLKTSVTASAALLRKMPESFDSVLAEKRFGLALLLKSYVPNVDCEGLVNDERYDCVCVVDKRLGKVATVDGGVTVVGGVVGGSCYRVWPSEDVSFVELALIAVAGSHQGEGLGAATLRRVEDASRDSRGASRILTYADNRAFAFFRRQGFSRTVTTPFALWKPKIVDYSVGAVVAEKIIPPKNDHAAGNNKVMKPVVEGLESSSSRAIATGVTECTSGRPNCYCRSGRTRAIVRYDPVTGATLETYCSTSDAARKLQLTAPQITHVLSGAIEDTKGHKFRYAVEVPWVRGGGPRAISEVDPTTGDVIRDYASATACARLTGLSNSAIGEVCSGKRNDLDGRVFRFKEPRVYPCAICATDHDAGTLLLCDGLDGRCVSTAHTSCIGLSAVPDTDWFCKTCLEKGEDVKQRDRRNNVVSEVVVKQPQKRRQRTKLVFNDGDEEHFSQQGLETKENTRDGDTDDGHKVMKKRKQRTKKVAKKKTLGLKPVFLEEATELRPRRAAAQRKRFVEEDEHSTDSDDILPLKEKKTDDIVPVKKKKKKPIAKKQQKVVYKDSDSEDDDDDFFKDDDDEDFEEEEEKRRKKKARQQKKRVFEPPPRDSNIDYCAACGDGGELICCDKCDRAYHLPCVNLDIVPAGDWHCSVCLAQRNLKKKETTPRPNYDLL